MGKGSIIKQIICHGLWLWGLGLGLAHAHQPLVLTGALGHPMTKIASHILTKVYDQLDIDFEVKKLPGKRSLIMVNKGIFDGELFRSDSQSLKDFPNLIKIPVVIAYGELVVCTHDLEFDVTGWESLRPYTIGSLIGIREVETHTVGMQTDYVPHAKGLFKKLITGRSDIVVIPRDHGLLALKDLGLQDAGIRILEPPLQRDALYHFLHKKHTDLVGKITAILKEMEKNGRLKLYREQIENELFH